MSKSLSRALRGLLALSFCSAVLAQPVLLQPACAQQQSYTIDGKPATQQMVYGIKLLNESIPLLQSGQNQEAVAKLSQAATFAPDVAEIHNTYGFGLAKLGRTDEAQLELEKAVALKPSLGPAWMTLGGLYQSQGKVQKSLDTYTQFINRFPTHPDVNKVKAIVAGMKKEIAEGTLSVDAAAVTGDSYIKELKGALYHWPASSMPIKVYITPGAGTPGYKPFFDSVLQESFINWANASNGLVGFAFVPSAQGADIVCSWTGDATQLANTAEAGETHVTLNSKGINSGTIKLLTVPLMKELPVTENFLRQTCLHEIGHALGFGGHTNNPADIMFFAIRISDKPPVLGPRDAKSIQMLYTNP